MRIREIAQSGVRCGCRKICALLNREGWDMGQLRAGWYEKDVFFSCVQRKTG